MREASSSDRRAFFLGTSADNRLRSVWRISYANQQETAATRSFNNETAIVLRAPPMKMADRACLRVCVDDPAEALSEPFRVPPVQPPAGPQAKRKEARDAHHDSDRTQPFDPGNAGRSPRSAGLRDRRQEPLIRAGALPWKRPSTRIAPVKFCAAPTLGGWEPERWTVIGCVVWASASAAGIRPA